MERFQTTSASHFAIVHISPTLKTKTNTSRLVHIGNKKDEIHFLWISSQKGKCAISISDIVYAEASGNYSWIYCCNGRSFFVSKTLKKIQKELPGHFIRCHQSFLVNSVKIIKVNRGHRMFLQLKNTAAPIPVSRRKQPVINRLLCPCPFNYH